MMKSAFHWALALTVAVVYLAVSLLLDAWAYSWLIWVAYAVYRWTEGRMNSVAD